MRIVFDLERTGDNIRFYREQRGWSKEELAKECPHGFITVRRIECFEDGTVLPMLDALMLDALVTIANALNVHPNQIMAWTVEGE